jgi:hypothetical protein
MLVAEGKRVSRHGQPRLEFGSHGSPDDGVCVVELASIIGGEDFSDRPQCVCEVLGAYLRSWNDRLGHAQRQRLRPYAKRVVGSRSDPATTALRRDVCLVAAGATFHGGGLRRMLTRTRLRMRIAWLVGLRPALRLNEGAGEYAARITFARDGADRAFDLLDVLLMIGSTEGDRRPRDRDEVLVRAELIARDRGPGIKAGAAVASPN